ncbi:MAG: hypothetical protein AUH81_06620 [Candidatus Rokubacteria bacterium 13_1_40CM_4_69_5]|nr:MAG: hypothetical protein AUH81_06620 [Candidatus Rokubacteria bacterium 13_1_40CM_4_69_5]
MWTRSQVIVAIGYPSAPSGLVIDIRKSVVGASVFRAPASAAVTDSSDGVMNLPDEFRTWPKDILLLVAYASSTYPIPPGVWFTVAATPSLPLPPSPTGQLTDVPFPTLLRHSGLTFER